MAVAQSCPAETPTCRMQLRTVKSSCLLLSSSFGSDKEEKRPFFPCSTILLLLLLHSLSSSSTSVANCRMTLVGEPEGDSLLEVQGMFVGGAETRTKDDATQQESQRCNNKNTPNKKRSLLLGEQSSWSIGCTQGSMMDGCSFLPPSLSSPLAFGTRDVMLARCLT